MRDEVPVLDEPNEYLFTYSECFGQDAYVTDIKAEIEKHEMAHQLSDDAM